MPCASMLPLAIALTLAPLIHRTASTDAAHPKHSLPLRHKSFAKPAHAVCAKRGPNPFTLGKH